MHGTLHFHAGRCHHTEDKQCSYVGNGLKEQMRAFIEIHRAFHSDKCPIECQKNIPQTIMFPPPAWTVLAIVSCYFRGFTPYTPTPVRPMEHKTCFIGKCYLLPLSGRPVAPLVCKIPNLAAMNSSQHRCMNQASVSEEAPDAATSIVVWETL
ncbi:hypothetical protein TNCV_2408501 [Trichonephila clavipes]|nr:hypothetical protein TNCV_2408501 [Trichonephila clavipes]